LAHISTEEAFRRGSGAGAPSAVEAEDDGGRGGEGLEFVLDGVLHRPEVRRPRGAPQHQDRGAGGGGGWRPAAAAHPRALQVGVEGVWGGGGRGAARDRMAAAASGGIGRGRMAGAGARNGTRGCGAGGPTLR